MATMPLRNRVTPYGEIVAVAARGTLMGNRGRLHDPAGRVVRHHDGRRWIACLLEFRGRRRAPMPRGRYTSLFFLDEATALAAGHRPCFECRRAEARAFRAAWAAARGEPPDTPVDAMDRVLHAERIGEGWWADAPALPDAAMVELGGAPHLLATGAALPWSPDGYGRPVARPAGPVRVLTPASVVGALRHGYRPGVHPTAAQRLSRRRAR